MFRTVASTVKEYKAITREMILIKLLGPFTPDGKNRMYEWCYVTSDCKDPTRPHVFTLLKAHAKREVCWTLWRLQNNNFGVSIAGKTW